MKHYDFKIASGCPVDKNDRVLLQRLVRQGEGEVFSIIMDRYADMVYSTCRRILGNDPQVADATQETFFHLLKSANRITGSLGSWLHQVATRRAVDLVRQSVSRRRREEAYALDAVCRSDSWSEVEPIVDQALEELPDELHEVLVLHYLEGQSMVQVAAALRVSQPTVSRRVTTALKHLREKLRERGITVSVAALGAILTNSTQATPVTLLSSLGKIALAQAASSSAVPMVSTALPVTAAGVKTSLAAAVLIVMLGLGWVVVNQGNLVRHPVSAKSSVPPINLIVARASAPQAKTDSGPAGGARTITTGKEQAPQDSGESICPSIAQTNAPLIDFGKQRVFGGASAGTEGIQQQGSGRTIFGGGGGVGVSVGSGSSTKGQRSGTSGFSPGSPSWGPNTPVAGLGMYYLGSAGAFVGGGGFQWQGRGGESFSSGGWGGVSAGMSFPQAGQRMGSAPFLPGTIHFGGGVQVIGGNLVNPLVRQMGIYASIPPGKTNYSLSRTMVSSDGFIWETQAGFSFGPQPASPPLKR